jgi:uncharacterized membrane protein
MWRNIAPLVEQGATMVSGSAVQELKSSVARTDRHSEPGSPAPLARPWWALTLAAGLLGLVTTTVQTVERIGYAKDPLAGSICDVNASLSCTAVFGHWQSSALGIPNSLVGAAVFALVTSGALAGLTGSRLSRPYLATLLGVTLFMAAFITWYLAESAFSMKVLCLYCVGCGVSITMAGIGLTRAAAAQGGLGTGPAGRLLTTMVRSGSDLIAWAGLTVLVVAMLVTGLAWL